MSGSEDETYTPRDLIVYELPEHVPEEETVPYVPVDEVIPSPRARTNVGPTHRYQFPGWFSQDLLGLSSSERAAVQENFSHYFRQAITQYLVEGEKENQDPSEGGVTVVLSEDAWFRNIVPSAIPAAPQSQTTSPSRITLLSEQSSLPVPRQRVPTRVEIQLSPGGTTSTLPTSKHNLGPGQEARTSGETTTCPSDEQTCLGARPRTLPRA